MTKMRCAIVNVCVSVLAAIFLVGCVSTGSLGLASRGGENPGDVLTHAYDYRELGMAEGRACRYFVLAIVPFGNSTISRALDKALQASGGDALLNATVTSGLYGFVPIWSIFSFTCTTIQGTAVKFEPISAQPPPD